MNNSSGDKQNLLSKVKRLQKDEIERAFHREDAWPQAVMRLLKNELAHPDELSNEELIQFRHIYYLFLSAKHKVELYRSAVVYKAVDVINSHDQPPFNAEYLLYFFLQREDREIVIGDLVECYSRVFRRFGKRRADVWFYKQVLGSLWPLLSQTLVKIGALVWLGKILRRLIS